ncbi:MAG: hypothetical protein EPN38_02525 [Rhodanobacteraceae bacterium]|nr:MAG: hypothetical protein EPN38_02525 [Rhodanobacteraceae bacterium]
MQLSKRACQWLPWLLLAVTVLVTAIVYWPGTTGGWVFDDYPNIVDNTAIHITRGHATLVAWINSALSSPASVLHRPLASLTFSANWYFGNGNPWPFKVTNIVIHLLNGVLVFLMLRALLRLVALVPPPAGRGWGAAPGEGSWLANRFRGLRTRTPAPLRMGEGFSARIDDAGATRLALIVSAAWMLLPINLMAVLYVVQRMESLCQVFVLAGLWAYLHGRWMMLTATDPRRDHQGFSLAVGGIVLGTALGLTSKETAVLLPVFALLAEAVVIRFGRGRASISARLAAPLSPRERGGGEGTDTRVAEPLREVAPSPAPAGHPLPAGEGEASIDKRIWALFTVTLFIPAVLGFAWVLRGVLRAGALAGRDFTLGQRLLTEPRVLVDYLHWTLLPNPEVLSLYHDEIVKSTGILTPWTTLAAIVFLAALVAVAVWLRNRRPLVSLGIGWFFAGNLLTATIVPLELVYEQRMYFASIGVLLAAGALLLGLRWKLAWPLLRGFLVAVALLWFAVATNLRAQEWSNPLRLAVAEAQRHPDSPRAVYEAGRLLLIASDYQPGKIQDAASKYLRQAAAIPGSSALPDQAMIMLVDHHHQGADAGYWRSMIHKLASQPTRQEDVSALISLTNCYGAGICQFNVDWLERAYSAALSRPHPIARLDGAYADFQRDVLHNDHLATEYLARAVAGDPSEPAYRVDLAALYARQGDTEQALVQIDALRRMNLGGRLDAQIAVLVRLAEQGRVTPP